MKVSHIGGITSLLLPGLALILSRFASTASAIAEFFKNGATLRGRNGDSFLGMVALLQDRLDICTAT